MVGPKNTLLYRLRFFIIGAFVFCCLLTIPLMLSLIFTGSTAQAVSNDSANDSNASNLDDSPNIITSGVFETSDNLGRVTNSATQKIATGSKNFTKSVVDASAQSGKFMVHGIGNGVAFMAHGAIGSFGFITNTTRGVVGAFGHTNVVSATIRPADSVAVPVIKASAQNTTATQASPPAAAASPAPQPAINSTTTWPIHGLITTEFGVYHMPYQPTHTGIDISDGWRSGVTPIHPFKPGRVIQVIHSNAGFGNHVIIDHGGGLTSLYGHMYSTSAQVGQQVDSSSVLGYEGTTGASSGPHVHFEIRLNGQPVNPHNYVSGQP
jgi:murein DD-endopeptidase MepM/ murein hydrolase activator NlpD